jgi:manganese oxidase
MRVAAVAAPLLALALAAPAHSRSNTDERARIALNDNREVAGRFVRGTYTLDLEIRPGAWHLLGDEKPAGEVLAFNEVGKPPVIPGPLARVPHGTRMHVRVSNRTDQLLVVRGFGSRRTALPDSLLIAPGEVAETRFAADVEGTFFYWAGSPGVPINNRYFETSQLYGAFVVDPPGAASVSNDRILMLGIWFEGKDSVGERDFGREFLVINGRPWPGTERLNYTLGDTVRWRVINTSSDVHPMHLHGFYYRVEARGDIARDTTYWPAEQRMVVTEALMPGRTMTMSFVPNRAGGWIFHCHLNWHVISNPRLGEERLSRAERENEVVSGHAMHDPDNHLMTGMGGLLLAFNVESRREWAPPASGRRMLRLLVQSRTAPGDTAEMFGYVLQEGAEPARDSVRLPGAPLILRKGEPTSIWVVNRSSEPTQIHWHGLELESAYDGVVGIGGVPGYRPPAIMPSDSFEMRITPPRAGSFMYHTHFNEIRQMSRGLWGPFIVLDPDEPWDPTRDLVFMAGEGAGFESTLNGRRGTLPPIELTAGETYRFRLMNVTMGGPLLEFWLMRNGAPILWNPTARDGHDLPPWQTGARRANQTIGIGETMDVNVQLSASDSAFALELRSRGGTLVARQPLVVRRRPSSDR